VPELITGGLGDPTDHGGPDPRAAAALSAFAAGQGSEHAVLCALAGARLLVPVVAVLAEAAPAGGGDQACEDPAGAEPARGDAAGPGGRLRREKVSEMALPTLAGADGRRAVLAFTCLQSLTGWRPDARPVPVTARQVWQAGSGEADAVVIDVAGPVPFEVDGARLAALAEGRPPPQPHEDPDVRALAGAALAGEPLIAGFALLPGRGGSDLTIELALAGAADPGLQRAQEAVGRVAERIVAAGGGRVRRGITVAASTGAASTGAASTGAIGSGAASTCGQPTGTPQAGGP
jgi:SseB protein N-terminal domain